MFYLIVVVYVVYFNGVYLLLIVFVVLSGYENCMVVELLFCELEIVRLFCEGYKVIEIVEKLYCSKKMISV